MLKSSLAPSSAGAAAAYRLHQWLLGDRPVLLLILLRLQEKHWYMPYPCGCVAAVVWWLYVSSSQITPNPSLLRKSGIPLSVETPAPPRKTIRFDSSMISLIKTLAASYQILSIISYFLQIFFSVFPCPCYDSLIFFYTFFQFFFINLIIWIRNKNFQRLRS